MRGIFTRDERMVMAFLVAALTVGAVVVGSGRMEPPRAQEPRGYAPGTTGVSAESAPPVDINTADGSLLETLPGIGPAKALAILELREKRGAFSSVDELDDVKGIGPATLERLRSRAVAGDRESRKDTLAQLRQAGRTDGAPQVESAARTDPAPQRYGGSEDD